MFKCKYSYTDTTVIIRPEDVSRPRYRSNPTMLASLTFDQLLPIAWIFFLYQTEAAGYMRHDRLSASSDFGNLSNRMFRSKFD